MTTAALQRARALADLGRWSEAVEALQPALADPGGGSEPWCVLARCELGRGRADLARAAAGRAVTVDPDAEWGHRLLSVAALRLGDRAGARAAAERALVLEPDLCEGLHLLATIRRDERGGLPDAEHLARRALQADPGHPLAWQTAAEVAVARRSWPQAESYARQGLALDPHDADLALLLGTALDRQGRTAEAGRAYAAAARADPRDHRARRALGRIGLPLVGGGLLGVKVLALVGVRAVALWGTAPAPVLAVVLAALLGGAYAVVELLAWRARRPLPPALRRVAQRERRAAARGWLASSAVVTAVLAGRAAATGAAVTASVLAVAVIGQLVLRTRLPLPAGQQPGAGRFGALGRLGQSMRRRFR